MAINFRLSYNTGFDYTDLLPRTAMENIKDTEDSLSYSEVKLTIPTFNGVTQVINMPLTEAQANAPFIVELANKTPANLGAYYTIDQIEAKATGFTITRLGKGSAIPIDVIIRFKERGV